MATGTFTAFCMAAAIVSFLFATMAVALALTANYELKVRMGNSRIRTFLVSAVIFFISIVFPAFLTFMLGFFLWFLHDAKAVNFTYLISAAFFVMVIWRFRNFEEDTRRALGYGKPDVIILGKKYK